MKINQITTLLLMVIFCFSCQKKKNHGEFLFYSGKEPIHVKHYELRENELGNLELLIKNRGQRYLIINGQIDSLVYQIKGNKYKACKVRMTKDKLCDFNYVVTNDMKKLDVNNFDEFEQEYLYIGQSENLYFLTSNNNIIKNN